MQPLPIWDIKSHHPHHRRQRPPLAVSVDPKPGQTRGGKGKVVVSPAQIIVHRPFGQFIKLADKSPGFLGEDFFLCQGPQLLILLDGDGTAGHKK